MRAVARIVRWVVALAVCLLVVIFAISNRDSVTLHFFPLPYDAGMPLFLALLTAMFIGALLGGVVVKLGGLKFRREHSRLRRRLKNAERELTSLKAGVVQDPVIPPGGPALSKDPLPTPARPHA